MQGCKILHSSEIDTIKWNACIANNSNGLIYAYSYFLNAMANNWYGLVVNNYQLIFPIPYKKKYGIAYCYMPAFTQQLGFIGNQQLITADVIYALQNFVKYASPYINFGNTTFANQNNLEARNNFIIDLKRDFSSIQKKYKKTIAYSLSKANKQHLQYIEEGNITLAVDLYQQYNQTKMLHVTANDYKNLKRLLKVLQAEHKVLVRKVINEKKELLSIVLLLKDNKRYYNIINATTLTGRKSEANYFLYHNLLQELCEQPMIFDFEGSDLKGVQSFYEKFGAINQPYFHWHYNKLPKVISWLKH